jgi:hypothetical protein
MQMLRLERTHVAGDDRHFPQRHAEPSRICRALDPRRISMSCGATRLNRYLSATVFRTSVNHGNVSASVPSMSKMTSLYFTGSLAVLRDPHDKRSDHRAQSNQRDAIRHRNRRSCRHSPTRWFLMRGPNSCARVPGAAGRRVRDPRQSLCEPVRLELQQVRLRQFSFRSRNRASARS